MKRRLLYMLLLTAAIALILGLTMTAEAVPPAGTCPASANGGGHEWKRRSSTEASCTTPGETIWICRNCKTRYKETTPARGHTWSAWYTMREPTCTTSGEEVRQCTYYNCDQGHPLEKRTIPPLGHSWSEWRTTREATCTVSGQKERNCSRCGKTETQSIPASHFWGKWQVDTEGTCVTKERLTRKCRVCGAFDYWEKDYGDHDWDEGTVTKQPTAYEAGVMTYTCKIEPTHTKTERIPPTGGGEGFALGLEISVADGRKYYNANETVTFDCRITNLTDAPVWIERLKTVDPEYDVTALNAPFGDSLLQPYESRSATVQYTTTQSDWYSNRAILTFEARGYDPKTFSEYDDYIWSDRHQYVLSFNNRSDLNLIVELTETSAPANGEFYTEGEVIAYHADITNRYASPLHNVEVEFRPNAKSDDEYIADIIDLLDAYETRGYSGFEHTVEKADCERGYYIGYVRAQSKEETDGFYASVFSVCGDPAAKGLKIEAFEANFIEDNVIIRCEVTNLTSGEVMLESGWYYTAGLRQVSKADPNDGKFLAPGDKCVYFTNYRIDPEDPDIRYPIPLTFYAKGVMKDTFETVYSPAYHLELAEKRVEVFNEITISVSEASTPANGKWYTEGEKILYEITVANISDYAVNDIAVLEMPMYGKQEFIMRQDTLAAGGKLTYTAEHTVTNEDVQTGSFSDNANVYWYSPISANNGADAERVYSPCGK